MSRKAEKKLEAESLYNLAGDPGHGYSRLHDLAVDLCWRKGKFNVATLDRALSFRIKKIPTGIFSLDWLTHGGIPLDRITRIWGPKNSCKTTTLLKILANTQKFCRYCKEPIVISPETGKKDCACPKIRYALEGDGTIREFLSEEDLFAVAEGRLPESAERKNDHYVVRSKDGKRSATMVETYRCGPMQTIFVETEHKLDLAWAERNGVETKLVVVVGSEWAEETIDTVEKFLYSREVDLVVIDTLSLMVPQDTISKTMEERDKIGEKARIIQKFLQKVITAQNCGGIVNATPVTVVCNTQVRTKGIGSLRTFLGPSDGNMMEHCPALDMSFKEKGYEWRHNEYASAGTYQFTIHKNHCGGSSGVSGTFKMWLDPKGPYRVGDTDDLAQVIRYGRETREIAGSSGDYAFSSRHLPKEQTKFGTLRALEDFLVSNTTVYLELRQRVLKKLTDVRTPKKEEKKGEKGGKPSIS